MTSMMDIIFLMLFFFITTSIYSQWENEIEITLPTAQSGKVPSRLPGEIIINITKDGRVAVNQQDLTLDELKSRLDKLARYFPGQPVVLRADKETRYEHIVRVIDTCRRADIWNFSMATVDEKKGSGPDNK
jgi:biopolymer transport protein ExbD